MLNMSSTPVMLTAAVTILAIFLFIYIMMRVGGMRGKHNIPAPSVIGHPEFERAYRVQMNTIEQTPMFLPALWLFCQTISPIWGALLGVIWIGGRILYSATYYSSAEKRGPGFIIGLVSTLILLIGSLVGSLLALSRV